MFRLKFGIPEGLLSSCSVLPALTAKNVREIKSMPECITHGYVAGITPKKVAIIKGTTETPRMGAARLMNQFGRKGVIRKKRISNRVNICINMAQEI